MPRLIKPISVCTLWLATAATSAMAQADSDGDRMFGRVSPDRPVVEIPAEQLDGIAPNTPPEAWDVRDPSRVNATQQIPASPGGSEPENDPALAIISPTTTNTSQPVETPAETEAASVVPYIPAADTASAPRLLGAPADGEALADSGAATAKPWWQEMGQTLAALGIVLALILVLAFVYTRLSRSSKSLMAPASGAKSPAGLIEVLAKYPVGPRQSLMLLKFDRRVLLVTQTMPRSGPEQMSTLCELTDPEDVASVLVKVRDGAGESMNDAFRTAMDRAGGIAATGPAANGTPAPEFMPEPAVAVIAEPKPTFQTDYDPEDLRQTVGGTEEERSQLWEDMGTTSAGRDPIGALRRKLDSMRGGQPG